ncbi:hypothetical protein [Novosphingobium rosa]|uniref:hypothetical protein n=1 Tax=Novosphingobium rosa TaxID=76978 RepID=UPI00082FB652|nr:hypothetical protein [Novosphingobium rosa]
MSTALNITITDAGRAALINPANTGTNALVIAAVGISGVAVTPDHTATSLPNEMKRVPTVGGQMVAADVMHVTMTDSSGDAYSVRSFGIYLSDGTLLAIYGQADPILTKTAASEALLAVDLQLASVPAAQITFGATEWLNPPATESTPGVARLATASEALAAVDTLIALSPARAKGALLGWLLSMDGAGSGIDTDLFRGLPPEYFTNIVARLGFTPARGQGMLGNVDLNLAITSGMYRVEQPVNGPANVNYGQLLVIMGGGDTITQILSSYSDGVLWTRSGNPGNLGGSGGWSPWTSLVRATSPQAYSAADVLAKLLTVDGAGSGVDSDRLRGYAWDSGQNVSFGTIWGNMLYTASNGLGQNVAIGDDAWIGDVNITDAIGIRGQQNGNRGYIAFGTGTQGLGAEYGGDLTFGGYQICHTGNDGAGSPFDAGLFWGQAPSYYTNIQARLGFNPVRQGGGSGQGDNTIYIGWSGSRVKIQVDGSDQGNLLTDGWAGAGVTGFNGTAMRRNGWDLYGPDNDGAGSPVDAGVFCGHNIDEFAFKANTIGFGQSAQNVAGIRGFNQNYVNDTGRAFFLTINVTYPAGGSNIWLIYVDGVEVGYNSGNSSTNTSGMLCALVPAGSTYSANVPTGTVQLRSWTEMRNV